MKALARMIMELGKPLCEQCTHGSAVEKVAHPPGSRLAKYFCHVRAYLCPGATKLIWEPKQEPVWGCANQTNSG